jgi:predicted GIY-YIG superfamily endonuclease
MKTINTRNLTMNFEQRIVYQSVLFMKDTHHIYQFTIIPTGHFYIGMTSQLEKRLRQHESELSQAISDRRVQGEQYSHPAMRLYTVASKILYKESFKKAIHQDQHVRTNTKIEVLGIVSGRESAKALERHLIIENSGNELLLNSRYANF